jgi:hypothetical protein
MSPSEIAVRSAYESFAERTAVPLITQTASEVVVEGDLAGDADLVGRDAALEEVGQLLDATCIDSSRNTQLVPDARPLSRPRERRK